jgi:hypothetical protein
MPANVINSGVPLAPGASAPLWTAACDNSTNLVNTAAPPDMVIPLSPTSGPGTDEIPFYITALDQIEEIDIAGTMRGKMGDTITVNLKHETYGVIPLLISHGILGTLTNAYPLPAETKTFLFGETIPSGYVFKNFVGNGSSTFVTLPENISPNTYYYYTNYYNYQGFAWQVTQYVAGAASPNITVPAHRYPYTPDYNYDNLPGPALVNGFAPLIIIYRGFRYQMVGIGSYEPAIVSTQVFANTVFNNIPGSGALYGYYPTGAQPWNDFQSNFGIYATNSSFSEQLYNAYNAHDWVVTSIIRTVNTVVEQVSLGVFGIFQQVIDSYHVTFLKWPDITWSVTALGQITWQSIFAPSALFQFYPPDYADYNALAERSETLALQSMAWKGFAADGVWTLEVVATSVLPAPALGFSGPSTTYNPNISPAIVRIDGLQVTVKFKMNSAYASANIISTVPSAGIVQAYSQGNLRNNGEHRAFVGILCGIAGSTNMGILCGYTVLRISRTGEIYDVAYFIATCCNINNVNSLRFKSAISWFGKDWGDRPFSTKGDAGEAFVLGSVAHRIYPVRGQMGLLVQVAANVLSFQMSNQYPVLKFVDPTVPLINTFTRISLNA